MSVEMPMLIRTTISLQTKTAMTAKIMSQIRIGVALMTTVTSFLCRCAARVAVDITQ